MAEKLPPAPRWDKPTFQILTQAVLENLAGKYRHQRLPSSLVMEMAPWLERAMQDELTQILLGWLQQAVPDPARPAEMIARVVSWSIFGAALQWSQEPIRVSLEQMTEVILGVIMEGVAIPPES